MNCGDYEPAIPRRCRSFTGLVFPANLSRKSNLEAVGSVHSSETPRPAVILRCGLVKMAPPRSGYDDACLEKPRISGDARVPGPSEQETAFGQGRPTSTTSITRATGLECEALGDAYLLSSPASDNLRSNRERRVRSTGGSVPPRRNDLRPHARIRPVRVPHEFCRSLTKFRRQFPEDRLRVS